MLSEAGIDTATAASGMTAFTLLQFATVAIVPVLLLPAVLARHPAISRPGSRTRC